jgi:UDP-N-acetyl-D-mannosaminuronic acid dehydrogenase
MKYYLCMIGRLGHFSLPLYLAFAGRGLSVAPLDISEEKRAFIYSGKMPFIEHGAEEILKSVLARGSLELMLHPEVVRESKLY